MFKGAKLSQVIADTIRGCFSLQIPTLFWSSLDHQNMKIKGRQTIQIIKPHRDDETYSGPTKYSKSGQIMLKIFQMHSSQMS